LKNVCASSCDEKSEQSRSVPEHEYLHVLPPVLVSVVDVLPVFVDEFEGTALVGEAVQELHNPLFPTRASCSASLNWS
jgi:hypothetical protein